MNDSTSTPSLPHPFYTDGVLYHATGFGSRTQFRAWQFKGWQAESIAPRSGCYIHAGLSGTGPLAISGPDARRYLQANVINSLEKFPVGSMKHAVMCDEGGLIFAHGIIERRAENEYYSFAAGPPGGGRMPPEASYAAYDVRVEMRDEYLFQIAGPRSLELLERVTGESLRDLGFLHFRDSSINGVTTEVARLGMTGGLAYELHGPIEQGPEIYEAVYQAGREFGIERLGWGTYLVNHVEGGFPQGTCNFVPTVIGSPAFLAAMEPFCKITGSVDPANLRARYRTPVEARWANMARFDHDFIGREALQAEMQNPKRITMTLRWNQDDVLDIYASLLRPGEPYKQIELPYAPHAWPQAHADYVLKDDQVIGYSAGTIYSYYFRDVISMGCIDIEQAEVGNEVVIHWGDYGGKIKDVRATVERFPYFAGPRNRDIDVTTIR